MSEYLDAYDGQLPPPAPRVAETWMIDALLVVVVLLAGAFVGWAR